MTTTTQKPEIGQSVVANGIRTNYLEAGSGSGTVVLIHGSGPGVGLADPVPALRFRGDRRLHNPPQGG
jgi:pimeloyl-ACP methyl ester carboxylesterase